MSMRLAQWDPIPLPPDKRPQHEPWMRVLEVAWAEGPLAWSILALCRAAGCRLKIPATGSRWIIEPSPLGVGFWEAMVSELLAPNRELVYKVLGACGRGEA